MRLVSWKSMYPGRATAAAAIALVLSCGCAAGSSTKADSGRVELTGSTSATTTSRHSAPSKVLVVIEENHSLAQMRGQMPYLNRLSRRYGFATDWHALRHPSEPNYLALAGGSTFGVVDDRLPAANSGKVGAARSVFGQALRRGRTAATFAESMPRHCALRDQGHYLARHNPWTYFRAERSDCRRHDLDTSSFAARARANRLPNVGFLIPNAIHDAHDAGLGRADTWLKERLGPVLASRDFESGALIVVVTADEDDHRSGNVVLTSVLTPRLDHVVATTRLTHYSLTRYIAQVLGVRPLKKARTAPDLRAAFGL